MAGQILQLAGRSGPNLADRMKQEQSKVGQRIGTAVATVKKTLQQHLNDPEMLRQMLEITLNFTLHKVSKTGVMQPCVLSLLGDHLKHAGRMNRQFCKALTDLTRPADVTANPDAPLERTALFEEMSKKQDEVDKQADEAEEERAHRSKRRKPISSSQEEDVATPSLGAYQDASRKMLDFLEPSFELLDNCPVQIKKKQGLKESDVSMVKHQVAIAAMAIKVHDPSLAEIPLRVAFVGAESMGKSSLINHLTSGGRGENFMPVSSGMGTQTMCICGHGEHEMVSVGGKQVFGNVESFLKKEQENIRKNTSGLSSLDVVRAVKPFHPPLPVELLDVPGIKEGKELETSLALGISGVLVICLGPLDKMKSSFEKAGSSLALLVDLWSNMQEKLRILGAVTRVKRQNYDEQGYLDLLQAKFPGVAVKVVFANFFEFAEEQKPKEVQGFYKLLRQYKPKPADPFELFAGLQRDMMPVMRSIWSGIKEDATPKYLGETRLEELKDTCKKRVTDRRIQCTNEKIKKSLLRNKIEKAGVQL